jgi:hypothetical protein
MEHHDRADELEREADDAGERSERLEREVEDARSDWEAKKSDESAPGAVEAEAAGPHNLDSEDPATGESKGEERQEEVEEAAQASAEEEDEER